MKWGAGSLSLSPTHRADWIRLDRIGSDWIGVAVHVVVWNSTDSEGGGGGLMIDNGRGRTEQNRGEERGVTWKDCIRAISLC